MNKNLIDKSILNYIYNATPNVYTEILGGTEFPNIFGFAEFYAFQNGLVVIADISGLPETETNIFAFHIHQGNSCDHEFSQTGGHYNPKNLPHPNHAGDLLPLFSFGGNVNYFFYTERVSIDEILGKTIIIHNSPDDFTSQPAGNSGQKIACGVIKLF